ncbi:MAG: hypothetical protein Q8O00_05745 [Holophaga sp.]|nr:hypothetical protein [Holophaga sp.]
MTTSRTQSFRALMSLGGLVILLGLMIPSPAGRLAGFVFGALCALLALVLARGWRRLWPLGLFALAFGLSLQVLPAYRSERATRLQRVHLLPQ